MCNCLRVRERLCMRNSARLGGRMERGKEGMGEGGGGPLAEGVH